MEYFKTQYRQYCFVMVNNYSMQENNHIDRSDLIVVNAQRKAAEQIEKERKKRKKDYIHDWFRFIELTNKYLKQKLN